MNRREDRKIPKNKSTERIVTDRICPRSENRISPERILADHKSPEFKTYSFSNIPNVFIILKIIPIRDVGFAEQIRTK